MYRIYRTGTRVSPPELGALNKLGLIHVKPGAQIRAQTQVLAFRDVTVRCIRILRTPQAGRPSQDDTKRTSAHVPEPSR